MAKVLYAWELGSGMGHLTVAVPVLAEMIRHGHQVAALICDPTHAERYLEPLGIQIGSLTRPKRIAALSIQPPRTFTHILHNALFANRAECLRFCKAISSIVEQYRPDLMICDHAPAALTATRGAVIPRIVWGTGFTCPPHVFPLPDWRPWLGDHSATLIEQESRTLAYLNWVLSQLKLPHCNQLTDLYAETTATLLTTYPELDHFGVRPDGDYVGAWPLVSGDGAQWPDAEGPKVFTYLKDTAHLDAALLALRQLGHPAIVVSPRFLQSTAGIARDGNLRLTSQPINMQSVAATCDIAILNGTHTTVVQMLRAGKPVISLPLVLEQQLTAMKIASMRAGYLLLQPTAQNVADAIGAALRPGELAGTERFARKYGSDCAESEIAEIVDRLEELLPR